jgi:hypothetical protein
MHAADRHPHVANLTVASVFSAALRLYRREPARVAGAALVLLLPPIALGAGSGVVLDALRADLLSDRAIAFVVTSIVAAMLATLGTTAYAGVLDELVGSVISGGGRPTLGRAIKALPMWHLIGADLIAALLIGVAAALGVLPGFVLAATLGIVGPVVNIEGLRPVGAIKRSLALTTRHLWLTLVLIGIPVSIEFVVHHWLLHVRHDATVLIELLVSVPLILTVGAFVGLTEVELAYALLARDDGSSVAKMVADTAPRHPID